MSKETLMPLREFTHEEKLDYIEFALAKLRTTHKNHVTYLCHHVEEYARNTLKMKRGIDTFFSPCTTLEMKRGIDAFFSPSTFLLTEKVFPEMHKALMETTEGKLKSFDGVEDTTVWDGKNHKIRIKFLLSLRNLIANE